MRGPVVIAKAERARSEFYRFWFLGETLSAAKARRNVEIETGIELCPFVSHQLDAATDLNLFY
jgi:hypothetical protein